MTKKNCRWQKWSSEGQRVLAPSPKSQSIPSPPPGKTATYVSTRQNAECTMSTQTCFIALSGACPLPTPKPIIVLKKKNTQISYSLFRK